MKRNGKVKPLFVGIYLLVVSVSLVILSYDQNIYNYCSKNHSDTIWVFMTTRKSNPPNGIDTPER